MSLFIAVGIVPGAVIGGRIGYSSCHATTTAPIPGQLLDPPVGGLELGLAVVGGLLTGVVRREPARGADRSLAARRGAARAPVRARCREADDGPRAGPARGSRALPTGRRPISGRAHGARSRRRCRRTRRRRYEGIATLAILAVLAVAADRRGLPPARRPAVLRRDRPLGAVRAAAVSTTWRDPVVVGRAECRRAHRAGHRRRLCRRRWSSLTPRRRERRSDDAERTGTPAPMRLAGPGDADRGSEPGRPDRPAPRDGVSW